MKGAYEHVNTLMPKSEMRLNMFENETYLEVMLSHPYKELRRRADDFRETRHLIREPLEAM